MKKILFSLLAIFAVTVCALAQTTPVTGTITTGATLLYPGSAVSNIAAYSGWVDVSKTDYIALSGSFTADAAGTNQSVNFVATTDTSMIPTNMVHFTLVIPYNSVTANVGATNWNVSGYHWIKPVSWGPNYDADSDVTNLVVKYSYTIQNK